jgi:hypothetical protein
VPAAGFVETICRPMPVAPPPFAVAQSTPSERRLTSTYRFE